MTYPSHFDPLEHEKVKLLAAGMSEQQFQTLHETLCEMAKYSLIPTSEFVLGALSQSYTRICEGATAQAVVDRSIQHLAKRKS
jgi:hypothetical protein